MKPARDLFFFNLNELLLIYNESDFNIENFEKHVKKKTKNKLKLATDF